MAKNYVVEEKDRKGAELYNQIEIKDVVAKSKDLSISVVGILQERMQFQTEGNWDNIFNLSDRFDLTRKVLSFADLGLLNAGIATRRYYKGGGYLRINPKFRVVDFNGSGNVIDTARTLMNMSLPSLDKDIKDLTLDDPLMTDIRENKYTVAGGAVGYMIGGLPMAAAGAFAGQAADKGFKKAADNLGEKLSDPVQAVLDLKDYLAKVGIITNSATPVWVNIGNYFGNLFVIENVSVELSREMTPSGPLYADFDMTLSTIEVATRNNLGFTKNFVGNGGTSRVVVE